MITNSPNIVFFTVATHHNHHLDRLLSSAKKHHINLHICGMGEPYLGNGKKRILMHEFLTSCQPDDLFLFVDAFDVIFLTNESEIKHTYLTHFQNDLVFGGEQNLGVYSFDDLYLYLKYPIRHQKNKYLNSGSIMGPVYKGIQLFETVGLDCEKKAMDQPDLIRHYVKHHDALKIDTQHYLFAVNGGRAGLEHNDYHLKKGRLYSTTTQTWPILFHVPGKFFIGLDYIAKQLGFMQDIPSYTTAELKRYNAAKREHALCEKLGLEPYLFRLIKNWSFNFLILLILFFIVQWVFFLFD